ncbi:hypothetical protein [Sporocytophaga myxococcoides]|uniref:hypothetical protein n=1 Tax=Sporocytophaga myxococcoides TaxID=153721 RepID=UPI00048FD904|nr:hypothetical protein [Sporocytophaga myxococcoides]
MLSTYIPDINNPTNIIPALLKQNLKLYQEGVDDVGVIELTECMEVSLLLGHIAIFNELRALYGAVKGRNNRYYEKDIGFLKEQISKEIAKITNQEIFAGLKSIKDIIPYYLPLLENNFEKAIAIANTEYDREQLAGLLAVKGEFNLAKEVRDKIGDEWRRSEIDLTLTIEYFKSGKYKEAFDLLPTCGGYWNSSGVNLQLVKGFSGFEPYACYPLSEW